MKKYFFFAFLFVLMPQVSAAQQAATTYQTYQQIYAQCIEEGGTNAACTTFATQEMNARRFTPTTITTDKYTPLTQTTTSVSPQTQFNPNAFCAGGKCTYTPLEPLPGLPQTFGPQDSFASLMGGSIKLFIWLGGIVAVVIIILGALTYMFSDIVGNKKRAIERIRAAMWGILILASSYLILNTINPQLVNFNLNINPFGQVTNPTPDSSASLNPQSSAEVQSRINACTNQCLPTGGSLRVLPDNTVECTCITGTTPL